MKILSDTFWREERKKKTPRVIIKPSKVQLWTVLQCSKNAVFHKSQEMSTVIWFFSLKDINGTRG